MGHAEGIDIFLFPCISRLGIKICDAPLLSSLALSVFSIAAAAVLLMHVVVPPRLCFRTDRFCSQLANFLEHFSPNRQ